MFFTLTCMYLSTDFRTFLSSASKGRKVIHTPYHRVYTPERHSFTYRHSTSEKGRREPHLSRRLVPKHTENHRDSMYLPIYLLLVLSLYHMTLRYLRCQVFAISFAVYLARALHVYRQILGLPESFDVHLSIHIQPRHMHIHKHPNKCSTPPPYGDKQTD